MNNLLLKRVMKNDKKEDIFHSSAYAQAQSGSGIGVASHEGFDRRKIIDSNRTGVKRYGDSEIANNAIKSMPKAKTYEQTNSFKAAKGGASNAQKSSTPPPARKSPGISF